jgi:putative redox protein
MSKTIARLESGYRTEITTRTHTWYADEPVEQGGEDSAPTPMEMLRGALGSCIAITLRLYAERKKWPLEGIDVAVESQRFNAKDYADYEGDEAFVHEFREHIVLHGPLTDDQKARLMAIAGKCPVRRAIASPAFFFEEMLEGSLE